MANFREIMFISDENDTGCSVDCFDLQLGTKIGMYASGYGVVRGSLQLVKEEFFMSAEMSKPAQRGTSHINVWGMETRNQIRRITIPGEITALGASDDGNYCAVAVGNKIHLWNAASGLLLNVINYHHEPITKIMFWNSNVFVSAGADGLVAVWRIIDLVTKEVGDSSGPSTSSSNIHPPFFSSSKHSLPITDMFVAPGGRTCRFFTVSADQTCNVFHIGPDSGKYVMTFSFDFVLTAVTSDHLQKMLYMGTSCGKVLLFSMEPKKKLNTWHINEENCILAHAGAVKVLAVTRDDHLIASGSMDKKIIIWRLSDKLQLHTCDMHGTISNIVFHVVRSDFLTPGLVAQTVVSNFERNVMTDLENMEVKISLKNDITCDDLVSKLENYFLFRRTNKDYYIPEESTNDEEPEVWKMGPTNADVEMTASDDDIFDDPASVDLKELIKLKKEMQELRATNRRLKRVNKKLYIFGLEQGKQVDREMLKNTKRDHYAKTQNLRDEAGALDYLETAGDILIKDLAKKQVSKITTLDEQLQIRQEFEKGAELKPWSQTGLSSLNRFQTSLNSEEATSSTASQFDYSLESIRNRSGLTRHELELGIAEKPGSQSSKLYKFALGNLKPKKDSVFRPDGHPLNRLKEIEEEAFGEKSEGDKEGKFIRKKKSRSRKGKRKRPQKGVQEEEVKIQQVQEVQGIQGIKDLEVKEEESKSYRPSLWDVKDIRKLCRKDNPGCREPKLYTIKHGKIVEVDAGKSDS